MLSPKSGAGRGRQGEDIAARWLEENGWQLIGRNLRVGRGELDIVARDPDGILVFLEVKSATGFGAGDPHAWIDQRKQEQVAKLAQRWTAMRGLSEEFCRFDALAVRLDQPTPLVEWIPDAFVPDGILYLDRPRRRRRGY